jgi:ribonuclease VapC
VIVDTSALVAILQYEPEANAFIALIQSNTCKISAATLLETAIVIDSRRSPQGSRELDDFVQEGRIAVVPVDEQQARVAREAYRDFGKGSGHKARLNFGDCFAYALARVTGEPLLYKGGGFAHTDVASALAAR